MAQIFISHIQTEKTLAAAIARFIREIFGQKTTVFLSSEVGALVPGKPFESRIQKELRECEVLVMMCSKASLKNHWIHLEAGAAWVQGKHLVPVCYAGQARGKLKRPYSSLQALDLERAYELVLAIAGGLNVHVVAGVGPNRSERTPKGFDAKPYRKLYQALNRLEAKPAAVEKPEREQKPKLPTKNAPAVELSDPRVTAAKSLLSDIAARARNVEPAGADFDKATTQAWIHLTVYRVLAGLFSFRVYRDFRDFIADRDQKMKARKQRPDGKSHMTAIADYLDELAAGLGAQDLATDVPIPSNFDEFVETATGAGS